MGLKAEDFHSYVPTKLKSGKLEWIKSKILETILKHRTKVVFIDHLGFLIPEISEENARDFNQNYSSYLGQLTRQLKSLAMEEEITIVLLAHTRKTKDSLDVEDIAHSAGIPQESDFVFMVERLKVNANKSKWANKNDEPEGDVYTPYSRVSLQKNRRTGYTKFIKAELRQGRLQEVKITLAQEPPQNELFIQ
jgi:replicative DNA helicase